MEGGFDGTIMACSWSFRLSGIGFGTWAWGNQFVWGYEPGRDDLRLAATFHEAIASGLTLVDTADSYGTGRLNGRSELLLGGFVEELPPSLQARPVIATKLAPFPWRLGRRGLDRAFQASRRRLKGHLQRVQLHWSTARYAPWQESALLDGLADLVLEGEVGEVGGVRVKISGARRPPCGHDVRPRRAELFASPLNCHHARYCSAFPDLDRFFGSRGSFFRYGGGEGDEAGDEAAGGRGYSTLPQNVVQGRRRGRRRQVCCCVVVVGGGGGLCGGENVVVLERLHR